MTAGRLAAAKPAATTNTTLYRCPIDKAASVVLNVCNQGSSAATYRAALRDYDQILTLDSADYSFRKGNVVTGYTLEVLPGIPQTQLDPGDEITASEGKSKFKYHDVLKPTDVITYLTKVVSIGQVSIDPSFLIGTFSVGDIITGSVTGLQAKIYSVGTNEFYLNIDSISASDTTAIINNITGIEEDDYISTNSEILKVSLLNDYEVTFTRGEFSTTAATIDPGTLCIVVRDTLNTTTINEGAPFESIETSLTLTSVDDVFVGSYISINNEFLLVQNISGNTVTVQRGVLGTNATTHNDQAIVKIYNFVGNTTIQFFQLSEEVDNGLGATVNLNIPFTGSAPFQTNNKFVYDFGEGEYEFSTSIQVDANRIIKFDQSDISNTGHPIRFSLTPDGIHNLGTEYITGVVKSGNPGEPNAYVQIDLSSQNIESNTTIYLYCQIHPNMTNSGSLQINLNPLYKTVYVYDVDGLVEINDSFTVNNVNYTIIDVNSGPYGYVQSYEGSVLKISLGFDSILFNADDTFFDSPRIGGSDRSLVTVDSISDVNIEDYIIYDKQISSNSIEKNTGIVVGPGQSLMIYSSANSISYSVNGFEDSTNDYVVIYYTRELQSNTIIPL
jgi:hypothetical protein